MKSNFGYVVNMTEHERGWGQRPDGKLVFDSEEAATKYINDDYKNRTGPVPDDYVSYDKKGYEPITALEARKIRENGFVYRA